VRPLESDLAFLDDVRQATARAPDAQEMLRCLEAGEL
jgi:hypothetical protein